MYDQMGSRKKSRSNKSSTRNTAKAVAQNNEIIRGQSRIRRMMGNLKGSARERYLKNMLLASFLLLTGVTAYGAYKGQKFSDAQKWIRAQPDRIKRIAAEARAKGAKQTAKDIYSKITFENAKAAGRRVATSPLRVARGGSRNLRRGLSEIRGKLRRGKKKYISKMDDETIAKQEESIDMAAARRALERTGMTKGGNYQTIPKAFYDTQLKGVTKSRLAQVGAAVGLRSPDTVRSRLKDWQKQSMSSKDTSQKAKDAMKDRLEKEKAQKKIDDANMAAMKKAAAAMKKKNTPSLTDRAKNAFLSKKK